MFISEQLPLILASKSPRRQYLLKEAGFTFSIVTQNTDESYPDDLAVEEVAEYIAVKKAEAVKKIVEGNEIIIAADTIVVLGNDIFGKPKDAEDAFRILKLLSGKKHAVITGICLSNKDKEKRFSVHTTVYFNELSDEQIRYYIDKYQPYDKAGAYAIQEWIGMIGIEKIEGCYLNIVGLPVSRLCIELKKFVS